MDVSFEKIPQLGTDCFRYLPILNEKIWTPGLKELHDTYFESRKDLALIDSDRHWELFLEFYELTHLFDSLDGSFVRLYRLKPGIHFDFPSKLGLIFASPTSGVLFNDNAVVLESKPTTGRALEFILFEGTFQFNKGSVFKESWLTHSL